ncbi:hypothetical protein RY831_03855 [Noviherbaspirillum sp. CPCC 100848]|uniref:Uncharacterized protein n=1 Tax=Noviherbaspirillum album TaxID=3080276 RepID=A0ABU6J3Q3_9BURK|nr:hypothetical protein [Noviherbaspirillum sp. CPCC 100848]MEC4718269.1 hypothetical protein [Noviherbaspirillum sp. CPCC 100848]
MNITGEFAMAAVGAMAIAGSVTPPGAVIAALAIAGAVIVVQAHSIILKYRYGRPSGFDITDETGAIISTSVGALLTVNGRAAKLTESLRKAAGAPSVPVIPGRHGELVKKTIDNMQETVVGKAAGDLSQEAFRVLPLCGNPSQRRNIDCVDRR